MRDISALKAVSFPFFFHKVQWIMSLATVFALFFGDGHSITILLPRIENQTQQLIGIGSNFNLREYFIARKHHNHLTV